MLFVHKALKAVEHHILSNHDFDESMWCKFKSADGENVLIGCLYKSPNTTQDNINRLINLLKTNEINQFDKICIMGDFNYSNIQ